MLSRQIVPSHRRGTGQGVRHLVTGPPVGTVARPRRVEPPGPAGPSGPDTTYCRSVQAWLATGRAPLTLLDERGLSDQGWAVLRHLAFELHAVLELADGAAPGAVQPEALTGDSSTDVPAALVGFVEETLALAEQDGAGPVPEAERGTVRALGRQVLAALWRARARR
jgi:hypothetical protein